MPSRETAADAQHLTGSHSQVFFYLVTGLLLALGTAIVLRSPQLRRASAGTLKGAPRNRRRGPREVVAELVHTPAVPAGTPALTLPANGTSTSVIAEPAELFDSALLLPNQEEEHVASDPDDAAVALETPEVEEFCEIAVWRGYAKSRFFAKLDFGDEHDIAVGESEIFGLRGKGVPAQTPAAKAAHSKLVAGLVEEGWEPLPDPDPWYATRFRRLVTVDENAAEYAFDA